MLSGHCLRNSTFPCRAPLDFSEIPPTQLEFHQRQRAEARPSVGRNPPNPTLGILPETRIRDMWWLLKYCYKGGHLSLLPAFRVEAERGGRFPSRGLRGTSNSGARGVIFPGKFPETHFRKRGRISQKNSGNV